jgi:uncharacterized membrane protein YhfC
MSLKAFHVVFILASALLTLGFGIWAVRAYGENHARGDLLMGAGSFVLFVVILFYGVWFLRKLRNVSYL